MPRRPHGIGEAIDVHEGDQNSTGPTCGEEKPTVLPIAHTLLRTGEVQEREHGEGKLQGENDLAEREQVGDAAVASESDDEYGRQNGQSARNKPPHPGLQAPMHEAFHDDLAGEGAGDGAALSARQ